MEGKPTYDQLKVADSELLIQRLQRENAELRRDETRQERGDLRLRRDELEAKLAAAKAALRVANIQRGRLPFVGNATPESRKHGCGSAFGCGFEHGFRGQKRDNPYSRNPQMIVWEQGFEYGEAELLTAIDAAKTEVRS